MNTYEISICLTVSTEQPLTIGELAAIRKELQQDPAMNVISSCVSTLNNVPVLTVENQNITTCCRKHTQSSK